MKISRGESIKLPRYHSYSAKSRAYTRLTTRVPVTGESRSVLLGNFQAENLSFGGKLRGDLLSAGKCCFAP